MGAGFAANSRVKSKLRALWSWNAFPAHSPSQRTTMTTQTIDNPYLGGSSRGYTFVRDYDPRTHPGEVQLVHHLC